MDINEISNRLEIQETVIRYSRGLDIPGRDFTEWNQAFSEDAVFVNWSHPGSEMSAKEMIPFLTADDPVHSHQHLMSNFTIEELTDSTAITRTEYLHVGVHRTDTEDIASFILKGGFYIDHLRKTEIGWRIYRHEINRRWDKYDSVAWPPANSTWGKTVMASDDSQLS